MAGNWSDYWDDTAIMADGVWDAQAAVFARRLQRKLPLSPEDVLLDIGCGNGALAALLAPRVRRAYGADTSGEAVRLARARHAGIPNLEFFEIPKDDYTSLDRLPVRGITKAVCVSVLQYYKSMNEVEALLENLRRMMSPRGGVVVFADLLLGYNLAKDIAGVLMGSLFSGTLCSKMKAIFSGNHRDYPGTRRASPLLAMERRGFESMVRSLGLECGFARGLTTNRFRANAIVGFPPNRTAFL